MLFNSLPFLVFMVLVFALYWSAANNRRVQNILLLAANYVFYAWWDWRFLALLITYGLVIYFIGHKIYEADKPNKKWWLRLALLFGIGTLSYFKYTNFFIGSFKDVVMKLGGHSSLHTLNIILPLGISFFTFQSLGYVLDINNGKIKPTTDLLSFMAFVSFFPTVLSGPIERADNLLVQLQHKRVFSNEQAKDGLRQILWGLFKKMVIADNLGHIVDAIYGAYGGSSSAALAAGILIFPFQLYADFSGYSDMATGIASLMGFKLVRNFAYPYFARSIPEYWRRWHMSLTSWITEYLYTPLSIALRDYGKAGMILAIFITYIIIGFWHGANWTYIVFGIVFSIYFSIFLMKKKRKKKKAPENDLSLKNIGLMVQTFLLVAFADLFFRAASVKDAFGYLHDLITAKTTGNGLAAYADISLLLIPVLLVIEWLGRYKTHPLVMTNQPRLPVRWAIYVVLLLFIFFCAGEQQKFIYLQF